MPVSQTHNLRLSSEPPSLQTLSLGLHLVQSVRASVGLHRTGMVYFDRGIPPLTEHNTTAVVFGIIKQINAHVF
jgi:hypothetical protein